MLDESPLDAAGEAFVALLSDAATTARMLDIAAERTGDARFRGAAGCLRSRHAGGRPRRADDGAVAQVAALLNAGAADTPARASRFVARTLLGEKSTVAASERIARKFRKQVAEKTG
jgi:hypothetical protein